jgi:hypothetical protein
MACRKVFAILLMILDREVLLVVCFLMGMLMITHPFARSLSLVYQHLIGSGVD